MHVFFPVGKILLLVTTNTENENSFWTNRLCGPMAPMQMTHPTCALNFKPDAWNIQLSSPLLILFFLAYSTNFGNSITDVIVDLSRSRLTLTIY